MSLFGLLYKINYIDTAMEYSMLGLSVKDKSLKARIIEGLNYMDRQGWKGYE